MMIPPVRRMMMMNWRNASAGGELLTETFHSHTGDAKDQFFIPRWTTLYVVHISACTIFYNFRFLLCKCHCTVDSKYGMHYNSVRISSNKIICHRQFKNSLHFGCRSFSNAVQCNFQRNFQCNQIKNGRWASSQGSITLNCEQIVAKLQYSYQLGGTEHYAVLQY